MPEGSNKEMPKSFLKIGLRIGYLILIIVASLWAATWFGMFDVSFPPSIVDVTIKKNTNSYCDESDSIESMGRNFRWWELNKVNSLSLESPSIEGIDFLNRTPNVTFMYIINEAGGSNKTIIGCRKGKGFVLLNNNEHIDVLALTKVEDLWLVNYDISGWILKCLFPNLTRLYLRNCYASENDLVSVIGDMIENSKIERAWLENINIGSEMVLSSPFVESFTMIKSFVKSLKLCCKNNKYISISDTYCECLNIDISCNSKLITEIFINRSLVSNLIVNSSRGHVLINIVDSYVPLEDIEKGRSQEGIEVIRIYTEGFTDYFQTAESALAFFSTLPDWPKSKFDGWSHIISSATGEDAAKARDVIPSASN